jgi:hypothetical protein
LCELLSGRKRLNWICHRLPPANLYSEILLLVGALLAAPSRRHVTAANLREFGLSQNFQR